MDKVKRKIKQKSLDNTHQIPILLNPFLQIDKLNIKLIFSNL
jgi:hypothetical protein